MSSTGYRALPSVGQTATGLLTSTNYEGFIGFCQIDTTSVGIREESHWSETEPLKTMLYSPFPNPGPRNSGIQVRYSLATQTRVSLRMYDLTGKLVSTLVNACYPAGSYSYSLLTTHHSLACGVYFLKMKAGDYQATRKLIIE
jgi:hypothetical protein